MPIKATKKELTGIYQTIQDCFQLRGIHFLKNAKMIIKTVKIESILIDKLPINPTVLNLIDYLRSGGEIPPVHLQKSEAGGYKLKDGRHRICAFKLLGIKEIKAKINIKI